MKLLLNEDEKTFTCTCLNLVTMIDIRAGVHPECGRDLHLVVDDDA